MKKTTYTLKDVKQPPVRLSSLRSNGIKHIDEIYRHELKMSNLVRKWKSSNSNANNYSQSVKLPAIHPSPFLRLVTEKHEMAANADASNRNSFACNAGRERYEPKNSQLPSINVPKLRDLEEKLVVLLCLNSVYFRIHFRSFLTFLNCFQLCGCSTKPIVYK